ncbi:TolC family protein [Pseudomonas koreensis]|uniref:TolC family protein n=1 Tax=Pseudomonas koreensis TaxID=198620 RepID=UPI001B336CFE|nr:TolC family protein [Pseudomonas koreensis]MBP4001603.1 TolC family protein [Pseudomonas koreensis]
MGSIHKYRHVSHSVAIAAALVTTLSSCAITPQPMTEKELQTRSEQNRVAVTAHQEPISGPISLYEAMARALKYNLDYKVEQLNQVHKERELKLSSFDMLPQLVANAGYYGRSNDAGASSLSLLTRKQSLEPSTSTERNGITSDLTLSWDILDFGLSYIRAHQKADAVLIAQEERRRVSNRVIEDVRTAYWRAVSAQRLLAQLGELQFSIQTTLANSEKLADRRNTVPLVALTYQRELLDIEGNVKSLTRELQIAKAQLAALMNLNPGAQYQLVVPQREETLPALRMSLDAEVATALRNRPELRQLGYQQRINERELNAQILSVFPNLKGFIGVNYDANNYLYNNHWTQYGARASFNLMNVFRLPDAKNAVTAEADLLRAKELATAMAVMTQVHVANARYALYTSELKTAGQRNLVQSRIMQQIDGGYRAGSVSQQTQLREQMNSLVSQVRYDLAYADAQNAYANLFTAMGMDSLAPDVIGSQSVAQVAAALKARWTQRANTVVTE